MRLFSSFVLLCIAIFGASATLPGSDATTSRSNAQPLSILRITPDGMDVPAGRQIVIQFNRPVVPIARMERDTSEISITITPELDCQWRWLNTSALACQLGEKTALSPATRYEIVVMPGIKAEDGATFPEAVHHSFITERPKLRRARFKTWKSPGMPYFRMTFNQPVSRKSVEKHLFVAVDSDGRQRISLNAEPDPDDKETPLLIPVPGENFHLVTGVAESSQKTGCKKEAPQRGEGAEARRVWLVSPRTELPLDTQVALRVAPGLASFFGPERGVEDRVIVSFHTFPEFSFSGVACSDNRGQRITISPGTEPQPADLGTTETKLIRLRRPTNGLQLAMDPRIPDDREAFSFELADVPEGVIVDWFVDDVLVERTSAGQYLWPLHRGAHVVRARLWLDVFTPPAETAAVTFMVK